MNLVVHPSTLKGKIDIPASKSIMHRALICAALSDGHCTIENSYLSEDILATIHCLEQLGACFDIHQNHISVTGISNIPKSALLDCNESGSTIRFLIPIAAAFGISATFSGKGKLITRPLELYQKAFAQKGVQFEYTGTLPASIQGTLLPGHYTIRGNVSSQFITGLLFALPLLDGPSTLEVLPPFESKSYVDITLDVLAAFGIKIQSYDNCYQIAGNQRYLPINYQVESDYSQAAFFLTANCLGSQVQLHQFSKSSIQGDSYIIGLLNQIGANPILEDDGFTNQGKDLTGFSIDASNIPDLVPILSVLACFCHGKSVISKVERLKIKESDRIASTLELISRLGGSISYQDDSIVILPCHQFYGAEINTYHDHRIAMAAAIAATRATDDVVILGAECVNKSYPTFFKEYKRLGGNCDAIYLE